MCSTGSTDLISCIVLSEDVLGRCRSGGAAFSARVWLVLGWGLGLSVSIFGGDVLDDVSPELNVRQFSSRLEPLPVGTWIPDVEGWGRLCSTRLSLPDWHDSFFEVSPGFFFASLQLLLRCFAGCSGACVKVSLTLCTRSRERMTFLRMCV